MNTDEKNHGDFYFCAKRELFEETGIIINTIKHKKYGSILLHNKLFYVIQIFKDNIYVDPIDKDEISGYLWYPVLELDMFINKNNCNRTIKDLEDIMHFQKKNIFDSGNKNKISYNNSTFKQIPTKHIAIPKPIIHTDTNAARLQILNMLNVKVI